MARRPVLKMGHPLLRKKARELTQEEIQSPWFANLVNDMVETMHSEDGVGIAAPQIGESVRVSVIEYQSDTDRYPDMGEQALTVFINPKVKVLSDEMDGFWEGCLSVPGLRGYVERPNKVEVEYMNVEGEKKKINADGFLAIVLQHEFDHLDGILYVDRVKDPTKLAYLDEYREFVMGDGEDEEI